MKILFVSPWFPYPPVNGSKQRIYYLLRALAGQHEVHLISFVRQGELYDPQGLEGLVLGCELVSYQEFQPRRLKALLGFFSSQPRSILDTHQPEMKNAVCRYLQAEKPDLAIFSQITTAVYCPASAIPGIFEEIETSTLRDLAGDGGRPLRGMRRRLTWQKQRAFLRRLLPRFRACSVASERERANLAGLLPENGWIETIPNGVDLQLNQLGEESPTPGRLIYNGALTYAANFGAVHYFLREIMPRIQSEIPGAALTVTGSTEGVDVGRLEQRAGLELTGHLADIRPLMRSSLACVVPLQAGGGTRLKILEAMALGVPVISTPKGAEGLDVTPEVNILIAADAASFALQAIRLMRDPDLRARLARAGRKLVEERYDWRKIGYRFLRFVEQAGEHG